jgi:hypothetical protein
MTQTPLFIFKPSKAVESASHRKLAFPLLFTYDNYMKRFLFINLLFIVAFSIFLIKPTGAFADDLTVSIQPDPAENNKNTSVIVEGCPADSTAAFTINWKNTSGLFKDVNQYEIRKGKVSADGMAAVGFTFLSDKEYWIDVVCGSLSKRPALNVIVGIKSTTPDTSAGGTPYPTLPPPPPPPCQEMKDGKCIKFNTAIGDIDTNGTGLIYSLFVVLLSISGGVALILIIFAGYTIMTSRGNAEQLQKGREMLVSALVGFLFLLFSFVILEVLTVDILHLPGFFHTGGEAGCPPTDPFCHSP